MTIRVACKKTKNAVREERGGGAATDPKSNDERYSHTRVQIDEIRALETVLCAEWGEGQRILVQVRMEPHEVGEGVVRIHA